MDAAPKTPSGEARPFWSSDGRSFDPATATAARPAPVAPTWRALRRLSGFFQAGESGALSVTWSSVACCDVVSSWRVTGFSLSPCRLGRVGHVRGSGLRPLLAGVLCWSGGRPLDRLSVTETIVAPRTPSAAAFDGGGRAPAKWGDHAPTERALPVHLGLMTPACL